MNYSDDDDDDPESYDGFGSESESETVMERAQRLSNDFPAIKILLDSIEKVNNEKHTVVKAQKFEEAPKLREREKKLVENLEELVASFEQTISSNDLHKLCIKIENGMIRIYVVDFQGKIYYADGTSAEHSLYLLSQSRWTNIISDLEKLINKPNLKEQELQDFFEEYPELILEDQFEKIIPQATIVKNDALEWRADFVIVPADQTNFSKILEFKLPNVKISRKNSSGHSKYSSKLYMAINQLRDYHEALNNPKTQEIFATRYNVSMFKPDLQLFIGRKDDIGGTENFLELQRRNNVKINDWDSVVSALRRKFR